uniref:Uncharacterized protein n=1 Tax=Rhizophora mucronata TaxID=61149 RepID=A0A2P2P3M2_RHIMU
MQFYHLFSSLRSLVIMEVILFSIFYFRSILCLHIHRTFRYLTDWLFN